MKKALLGVLIVAMCLVGFAIYRFDAMDLKPSKTLEIQFASGNDLSGSLYLPDSDGPYKVVVFVHGDGPADRTLDGGYNFIMNRLLEAGYACFSYDKAGVGDSSGNWLKQSMADRAKEVMAAIPAIREKVQVDSIGTLAFSQGGWVTSELALMDAPLDFYIVAGGAIDWMQQHLYFETQYAKASGFTEEETRTYLDYVRKGDQFVAANDYDDYVKHVRSHNYGDPMPKERFSFAYLNHKANATEGARRMKQPFLGVFGDADQNVNVQNSMSVYEKTFKRAGKTNYDLRLFQDATHELIKAKYNEKKDSVAVDSFLYGDGIFAEGFLDYLVDWLDKTLN